MDGTDQEGRPLVQGERRSCRYGGLADQANWGERAEIGSPSAPDPTAIGLLLPFIHARLRLVSDVDEMCHLAGLTCDGTNWPPHGSEVRDMIGLIGGSQRELRAHNMVERHRQKMCFLPSSQSMTMRRMKSITVAVLAILTIFTISTIAQSPIRPGRWEVTMQMQMAGSPIQMPEMKTTRCVTPEDAKDPARSMPTGPEGRGAQKSDCKMSDYKMSGNTASWKMVCTSPQPMTMTGEMTFNDDSYTGTMKSDTPQGQMTMKMAGTRVGECK